MSETIQLPKTPNADCIKVVTTIAEGDPAEKFNILISIRSEASLGVKKAFLDKFNQRYPSLSAALVETGNPEDPTWMFSVDSIRLNMLPELQGLLAEEFPSAKSMILQEQLSIQSGSRAQDYAIGLNKKIAGEVASILGVRLQGIQNQRLIIEPSDWQTAINSKGNLPLQKIETEYLISRFSSLRYNLKNYWFLIDWPLVKKQLRFTLFKYRFMLSTKINLGRQRPAQPPKSNRVLVVGHFSFPGGGGTFGDIEAHEILCEWLTELNVEYDVASNGEDGVEGLDITRIDESQYGVLVFVCGPWYSDGIVHSALIRKFNHCVKIGLNLTTFEGGNAGFDHLLVRDSSQEKNADIAFAKEVQKLPVVGFLLVDRQSKYGLRQRHLYIRKVVEAYLERAEVAPVWLDTNANLNKMKVSDRAQFESIVRRTDLVVTNRLHGLVLSLKNSVPVIAIDPVEGGGKITAQAQALGWPILIPAEELSDDSLQQAIRKCLEENLEDLIRGSRLQAIKSVEETKKGFLAIFTQGG